MNELAQTHAIRHSVRRKLFVGVSSLALVGYASAIDVAKAEDAKKPILWVELDGQYSQLQDRGTILSPPFLSDSPFDGISHLDLEKGPRFDWDKGAKIVLQPDGSDWFFLLGARYGKSSRSGVRDSHPAATNLTKYSGNRYSAYQNLSVASSESHVVLDFQAGKDVGIGSFGKGGSSTLGVGIRVAQFRSRNHTAIRSQPTNQPTGYATVNKFDAVFDASKRFNGIGPSISWSAYSTIVGKSSSESITFDWGVNGALLFGRQKTTVQHSTEENRWHNYQPSLISGTSTSLTRSHSVAVPNFGGFAGISWRYPHGKVSLGYRADLFFGAMDEGVDMRATKTVGFYGPFASVSIGLGG